MPETKPRSSLFLIFVIMGMLIVSYFSLSGTNVTFGQSYIPNPVNTTSAVSSSSFFNSSTTALNASSLTGSALSVTNSMRNSNETVPLAGKTPYIADNNRYIFSQNQSEISTPSNNSHTGEFGEGVKIAAVMPTFTAAAYDNAFYVFYRKYINVAYGVNITTDLNLLTSKVTNEPSDSASGFSMVYLLGNLKWTQPGSDITFLTDQDVDAGAYI